MKYIHRQMSTGRIDREHRRTSKTCVHNADPGCGQLKSGEMSPAFVHPPPASPLCPGLAPSSLYPQAPSRGRQKPRPCLERPCSCAHQQCDWRRTGLPRLRPCFGGGGGGAVMGAPVAPDPLQPSTASTAVRNSFAYHHEYSVRPSTDRHWVPLVPPRMDWRSPETPRGSARRSLLSLPSRATLPSPPLSLAAARRWHGGRRCG